MKRAAPRSKSATTTTVTAKPILIPGGLRFGEGAGGEVGTEDEFVAARVGEMVRISCGADSAKAHWLIEKLDRS